MKRPLDVVDTADAKSKVSDIKVHGNPDIWRLLTKASSEALGFSHSTKVMDAPGGALVLVDTREGEAISKALTFVPGATANDFFEMAKQGGAKR